MAENPIFDTCQICKQDGQLTRELHSLMSRLHALKVLCSRHTCSMLNIALC